MLKNYGVTEAEASAATSSSGGVDGLLGGRLRLRQGAGGHRAGTDAVLLAAAAPIGPQDRFIDVGCGVGTVGLALALRVPAARGLLLDDDPVALALAEDNIRLNGCEGRLATTCADLFDPAARRAVGVACEQATLVVTNPPFFRGDDMRLSADPARIRAHALGRPGAAARGHADWLRAALALLAPQGRFCAIHRPEALPQLLAGCAGRLGAIGLVPVHARRDTPAIRILLGGVKGSRAPLRIGPCLILHEPDGRFTPEAEALHAGCGSIVLPA